MRTQKYWVAVRFTQVAACLATVCFLIYMCLPTCYFDIEQQHKGLKPETLEHKAVSNMSQSYPTVQEEKTFKQKNIFMFYCTTTVWVSITNISVYDCNGLNL